MVARRGRNGRDVMAKKITNPIEIANWKRSQTERIKSLSKAFVAAMSLSCVPGGRTKTAKTVLVGTASPSTLPMFPNSQGHSTRRQASKEGWADRRVTFERTAASLSRWDAARLM